ncbi:MAG: DUF3488 domain-containing transglutaminase family protein [Gammaproteobacteria bacterium]|nr:DUF3488 domain-containing transglutaminase family protein [Gammaproteobacteria bacterium]
MSKSALIPQATLFYLFLSVFCALMLHVMRLPLWLVVFSLTALAWRMAIFSGKMPKPNWMLKFCLVSGGFLGIYFSYGAQLSIEGMVSLLIAGVMLKPLEVEKQADSYLLLFLNYFLCALIFLFDRTPLIFLLAFLVMLQTLSAQVLVHFQELPRRKESLSVAFGLFLKTLPLAVVLFVVLPRIGPLWTLNIPTKSGVVGLSDSMSPGSIASLGESDDLAFRVELKGGTLPMADRYWRGFTLSRYDGFEWQRDRMYLQGPQEQYQIDGVPSVQYRVLLEPHEKNWLFAVGLPITLSEEVQQSHDGSLYRKRKVYNQWQYQVEAQLTSLLPQMSLSAAERKLYTSLPSNVSLGTRELAKNFNERYPSVPDFLAVVKRYIESEGFVYTLSPGDYSGENQIDDFLFNSKTGFCAYYAGALTFMLRSIDVPARVVLGYMGGEDNAISNTISVYQYEAHAWVEVYIEGKGWLRVDPTAWVSPDRVESGLQRALPNEFKGFTSEWSWLRDLRRQLQAFDYFWNDWMVSYKGSRQQSLLNNIWGDRTGTEIAWLVASVLMCLVAGLFFFLWLDQRRAARTYSQKIYDQLYFWLHSDSKEKEIQGLTVNQIVVGLKIQHPQLAQELDVLNKDIHSYIYAPDSKSQESLKTPNLLQRIKQLRKASK